MSKKVKQQKLTWGTKTVKNYEKMVQNKKRK